MDSLHITEITHFSPELTVAVNRLLPQLSPGRSLTDGELKAVIDSDASILLFAYCGDLVAGMLTLGRYPSPTGLKLWIEDVVVDEAFRGRGIGRRLVEQAISLAETAGNATLMLTSNPTRVAANGLYRAIGFEQKVTNVYRMKLPR